MITGAHVMIFSRDPEADREFLRDMLELPCIDSGGGWLIFKLPPAELGIHGGEKNDVHELYLICDDVDETVAALKRKGRRPATRSASANGAGSTGVQLPGGGKLGIYEARHQRP